MNWRWTRRTSSALAVPSCDVKQWRGTHAVLRGGINPQFMTAKATRWLYVRKAEIRADQQLYEIITVSAILNKVNNKHTCPVKNVYTELCILIFNYGFILWFCDSIAACLPVRWSQCISFSELHPDRGGSLRNITAKTAEGNVAGMYKIVAW